MLKVVLYLVLLCATTVMTEEDDIPPITWMFPANSGMQLIAAVGEDNVYVASSDLKTSSQFYAIDRDDGSISWQMGTGGPDVRAPVVSGGHVFSTGGGAGGSMTLINFEADTSSSSWRWYGSKQQSSVAVSIEYNMVYVATDDLDTIFALYVESLDDKVGGSVAWSISISNEIKSLSYREPPISPTYDRNTGYVFAGAANILVAINGLDGRFVWKHEGINITAPPTVTQGVVLVGCTKVGKPGITAFNASNGIHLWWKPTLTTPTSPVALQDGSGRIAYSVLPASSQPGGVWVLTQPELSFQHVLHGVDASYGAAATEPRTNTSAIKYLTQVESWEECKNGCQHSYCNASSFIWYSAGDPSWKYGCYCRIDGVWETQYNSVVTSGQWTAPDVNWTFTDAGNSGGDLNLLWSSPVSSLTDNVLYVNAVNQTHEILYALKEKNVSWSYAVDLMQYILITPSKPVVSEDAVFFASQSGTLISFMTSNHTPSPPLTPAPSSSHWYTQARWISTIILGVIVIAALILCFSYNRKGGNALEHTSPGRKYQVLSELGSGSYGVVFLVRRKHDKMLFALKYLSCDSDDAQERALLEFRTMRSYQGHPNMIRVQETFMNWSNASDESSEDKSDEPLLEDLKRFRSPKYVCLVMPFYRQGDLKQFTLNFEDLIPEGLLLDFAAQICSLLQYLHDREQPLIHRDLKPENILLTDDLKNVVVTDFGLAKKMHNRYCATRAGTLCYMAPECWSHHYGKEADVWAVGCIMYAVASKRLEEHNIRVMFSEALQTEFFQAQIAEELEGLGYPMLSRLVASLLEPDYHTRPTASDVLNWLSVDRFAEHCVSSETISVDLDKVTIPPLKEGRPLSKKALSTPSSSVAATKERNASTHVALSRGVVGLGSINMSMSDRESE